MVFTRATRADECRPSKASTITAPASPLTSTGSREATSNVTRDRRTSASRTAPRAPASHPSSSTSPLVDAGSMSEPKVARSLRSWRTVTRILWTASGASTRARGSHDRNARARRASRSTSQSVARLLGPYSWGCGSADPRCITIYPASHRTRRGEAVRTFGLTDQPVKESKLLARALRGRNAGRNRWPTTPRAPTVCQPHHCSDSRWTGCGWGERSEWGVHPKPSPRGLTMLDIAIGTDGTMSAMHEAAR